MRNGSGARTPHRCCCSEGLQEGQWLLPHHQVCTVCKKILVRLAQAIGHWKWKVPIFLLAGFVLCMGGMLLIWESYANILENHRTCHNNIHFLQNPGNRQSEVRKQAIWDLALHGAGTEHLPIYSTCAILKKKLKTPPEVNLSHQCAQVDRIYIHCHLWKIALITPVFLWFCWYFGDLVQVQRII